ncbi:DUF4198 domain-containing protein [Desulfonema magnum]|uniref:DUF4198 n=1 Tax=Desulfonema magnum TaxID=45655 RepID=A0A975GT33_9BACT|nr:DUF4198 domain-containing protein [Desulfonema magnum]QTA92577.1 DUF4198 [Desulfonema magnum]
MKAVRYMIAMSFLIIFATASAQAHMLWLNVDDYGPAPGKAVQFEIGWGHQFPAGEEMKEGMLNKVYVLDESGNEIPLKQITPVQYSFVPENQGTYRIAANINPGFVSKTTDGYKLQTKKGLENVVFCFRYDMRTKAVISAGAKGEKFGVPAGDKLEIIPLKDPTVLKEGETFSLKVIYDGKPLSNAEIKATYEGFSGKPHTYPYEAVTDNNGEASVKITQKGNWLVSAGHKLPYPDKAECDDYKYNYTFTFNVK